MDESAQWIRTMVRVREVSNDFKSSADRNQNNLLAFRKARNQIQSLHRAEEELKKLAD